MERTIGILTAGGDSPGLNAAIRAVGKAAHRTHAMHVIGFRDGFRGLMQNRHVRLDDDTLSGILTKGGTILGTNRERVHKMDMGDGKRLDMRPLMRQVVEQHGLQALVCLGGGGTQKNARRLLEVGIPVLTLPKTIDNDVWGTDVTFGYDTALGIATEAIDRLHSTAHSHHRIMVVEVMGHNTGWLALGAGLAAGADVILVPEIPYDVEAVAGSILERKAAGSSFSIVVVSEGAMTASDHEELDRLERAKDGASGDEEDEAESALAGFWGRQARSTEHLAAALESRTGLEARVTILGHVQRGGTPSPVDRLLATRLGTACADYIAEGIHGVLVAARGEGTEPVPLDQVAGRRKVVPGDHPWLTAARRLGICLGD
jgi:ATP-dependent phosphofructokinase / diphosphate-dependent phosphofructokinase